MNERFCGAKEPGMQSETVSIVVPTYNQGRYLTACLDSVWFQDYPQLEILLVDDGSTDNTATVIAAFERAVSHDMVSYATRYDSERDIIKREVHSRYPQIGRRLQVIRHDENRGLAAALNTGFAAAKGTYCTYVPSDDALLPSMISEMVVELERGVDFIYADMAIVDDSGHWVRRFSLPDYSFERCFADWYLCGVAKLYRRELHERFGWYDETLLAHDHELFQRFALGGAHFVHIPRVLMHVRDHANREVDIHSPSSWDRLLEESKALVLQARAHRVKKTNRGNKP
jgi:glycosyltransferase involved in cell wall biosynthesis